jgi:AcrR family transcriptional regulator
MSVLHVRLGRDRQPRRARRPRTYLRADDRRLQILAAAQHVFARRGYHTANIDDICKQARIARGTLYQYFPNKRAVMLALMRALSARIEKVLAERAPMQLPAGAATKVPVAQMVAFCKHRLRQLLDAVFVDEQTLRLILRDSRGLDGAFDQIVAGIDALFLRALEADLDAAQSARLLRKGNPKLVARYLLGGIEKMVLTALLLDEPVDLDAVVDLAVDLELFGILNDEVPR